MADAQNGLPEGAVVEDQTPAQQPAQQATGLPEGAVIGPALQTSRKQAAPKAAMPEGAVVGPTLPKAPIAAKAALAVPTDTERHDQGIVNAVKGYAGGLANSVGLPESVEEYKQQAQESSSLTPTNILRMLGGPAESAIESGYGLGKKALQSMVGVGKEAYEAGQNIGAGQPILRNLAKPVSALAEANVGAVPFIGEPTVQAGHDIAQGQYAHAAGELTGVIGQVALPELQERFAKDPTIKFHDEKVAEAQKELDAAKKPAEPYVHSAAQGIHPPDELQKPITKAQEKLDEAVAHRDLAKEAIAKQMSEARTHRTAPTAPVAQEIPTEKVEAAPQLAKLGTKKPALPQMNVKTPGQVQPETFPQEPTAAPRTPLGRMELAGGQGTVGKPRMLTEGTPEGPQIPEGGLPKIKAAQEVLPPVKAAKPERGNVKALTVDEKGNVIDKEETPEGRVGRLLKDALTPGEQAAKSPVVEKPVEKTPEAKAEAPAEKRAEDRRQEEVPVEDERRQGERRVLQGINEKAFQESAFGTGGEKRIDTDAYAKATEQARKELGPEASKEAVIARRNELVAPEARGATGDVGQQSREANPEPTRAETKGKPVLPNEEKIGYAAKKEEIVPTGAEGREPAKSAAEYHPDVEQKINELSDENIKKLAKAHGLNPEEYDFKARDEGRHRIERDQMAKDIAAQMGEDEKVNLGRAAEAAEKEGTFTGADVSAKGRAARAEKVFPRLRGPVDENGNPTVSGGAPDAEADRLKEHVAKTSTKDTDHIQNAIKELGPDAKLSDVMDRAQKMKEAAKPVDLKKTIDEYNKKEGLGEVKDNNKEVDPRSKEISKAYEDMKHDPNNPEVKKSYKALIDDAKKQWDTLEKAGIKIEPQDADPYKSYEDMKKDFDDNKRLKVFRGGNELPEDHPLSKVDPKTGETYNVMFRAVHDAIGHLLHDNDFSEKGEENAFDTHSQTMSKEAIPAMTTETKGQVASFFNKEGGQGFPDQKAGLLPDKFIKDVPRNSKGSPIDEFGNPTVSGGLEGKNKQALIQAAAVDRRFSHNPEFLKEAKDLYNKESNAGKKLLSKEKMQDIFSKVQGEFDKKAVVSQVEKIGRKFADDKTLRDTVKSLYQDRTKGEKPLSTDQMNDLISESRAHLTLSEAEKSPLTLHNWEVPEEKHTLTKYQWDVPEEKQGLTTHDLGLSTDKESNKTPQLNENDPYTRTARAELGKNATADEVNDRIAELKSGQGLPSVSGGAPEKKLPTGDQLIKKYGESSGDPKDLTFILKDGRGVANTGMEHDHMLGGRTNEKVPPRERFIAEGNIRVRPRQGQGGREVALSIPEQGVTDSQLKYLQKMSPQLKSGAVMLEVGKPGGGYRVIPYGEASTENLEKSIREIAPVLNDKGSPIDVNGNPTVSGGSPAAGTGKAKGALTPEELQKTLPELAQQHLTDAEKESLTTTATGKPRTAGTQKFIQNMEKIPSVQEYTDIALQGEGSRKWYSRSTAAFDAMHEEAPNAFKKGDKEKFMGVLAGSSPQQSVAMNLRETLGFWKEWNDAGRPQFSLDKWKKFGEAANEAWKDDGSPRVRGLAKGASMHWDYAPKGDEWKSENLLLKNLTLPETKVPNIIKALNGEQMWPDLQKNAAFKAPSFAENLRKWIEGKSTGTKNVTNDSWMGLFGGIDKSALSKPENYHPLSVATRAAAENLGWEPEEAQAAIWSFTQALTEKGVEDPELVRHYSEDFKDLLANDLETRNQLKDLGVNLDQLDSKLEAIGEKPQVSSRGTPTTASSIVELKRRIEKARGEGTIPEPKTVQGNLFRENPAFEHRVNPGAGHTRDEAVRFDPQELEDEEKRIKKLGGNKTTLGRIK